MRELIVVVALVMVGIALLQVQPTNDTADEETHSPTPAEIAANLDQLYRVTDTPFGMDFSAAQLCLPPLDDGGPPDPHANYYCHVFINDVGLPTMKTGKGEYPVGTVIVKQKFKDPAGKRTELFTLMRKREDGYDPDHGNWEYSTVDQTATGILSLGRTESCIDCHSDYAETDYVTRKYVNY